METELKKIFAQVFNTSVENISILTKQNDLEEWNSLGQLRLIMEIESAFNISFLIDEIATLDSFDKILENIKSKTEQTK